MGTHNLSFVSTIVFCVEISIRGDIFFPVRIFPACNLAVDIFKCQTQCDSEVALLLFEEAVDLGRIKLKDSFLNLNRLSTFRDGSTQHTYIRDR